MPYRPPMGEALGKPERFVVCITCFALVSQNGVNAHDSTHKPRVRSSPVYEDISVGRMKEILAVFPDDLEIGLEVSGYEWDSAVLGIRIADKLFPLYEV